jgi:hypothetical protein
MSYLRVTVAHDAAHCRESLGTADRAEDAQ